MVVKGEEFQVFVPSGTDGRWMFDRELHPERGDSVADWTEDRAVAAIRQAAGVPDLDIEVIGSFPWTFAAAVASGVQAGRAFLVGDAAHRTTPRGATGMNTGIADGHNLGWKLGWVARGLAGESLLATYAEERYPVGLHNALASLEAFAPDRGSDLSHDFGVVYASARSPAHHGRAGHRERCRRRRRAGRPGSARVGLRRRGATLDPRPVRGPAEPARRPARSRLA